WNFCLRYAVGINTNYFFPSKLFNVVSAPGSVIVNNFRGLPASLCEFLFVVADDLSNLPEVLMRAESSTNQELVSKRRKILLSSYSWRGCISRIFSASKDSMS